MIQQPLLWIINASKIYTSSFADMHNDLHVRNLLAENTIGGGKWHWDDESGIVYFYGSSPYGKLNSADFETILSLPGNKNLTARFNFAKIYFSEKETIDEAIVDCGTRIVADRFNNADTDATINSFSKSNSK